MDLRLSIPFTVPVLGEAYASVNNPVMLTALDFFTHLHLVGKPSRVPGVPIASPPLRRALIRLLRKAGISEDVKAVSQVTDPVENDFLVAASLVYAYGLGDSSSELIGALGGEDDRSFLTLSRALAALSGGFTVVRRGEGAISLEGDIDAAFHLSLCRGKGRRNGALTSFAEQHPDLAPPTWHLLGHIALEGGRMVREGDPRGLGKLMNLEAGISQALGILDIREMKSERLLDCYGSKPIRSKIMTGELILAPKETLPLPPFNRFKPTQEGVREVD